MAAANSEPSYWPLECDESQMRTLAEAALSRVITHLTSLREAPAWGEEGGQALAETLRTSFAEEGAPLDMLLDTLFDQALDVTYNTASGGYFAFIPGGGLFASAVADLIADSINRYVAMWIAAPGLVQMEADVVRWCADLVGLGPEAGGYLSSGGSMANLTAVITARREKLPPHFLEGVLYTSDQAHHSVKKAALLAGFPQDNLRTIPVDSAFRMRVDALAAQIGNDRAAGLRPFMVVANGGSTNTGAVDPLPAIADVCHTEDLWLHVDAAYGGFFLLTERGRKAMRGIEQADSVTMDPHKGLFLPLGTGCLVVRDRLALLRAHAVEADYLPEDHRTDEFVNFADLSPELSRDFRGLRVWLPLRLHGVGAFRAALDEKFQLSDVAHRRLQRMPSVEIVALPQLTITTFRMKVPGASEDELNELNREFWTLINEGRRFFLSPTIIDGRFVIRLCILHLRTHREIVDYALDTIERVADKLSP
ncbi:MAG TPA: aminotransferase class V-fold PLP-dependent enzyme [Acidimicrobiia bacterium]